MTAAGMVFRENPRFVIMNGSEECCATGKALSPEIAAAEYNICGKAIAR